MDAIVTRGYDAGDGVNAAAFAVTDELLTKFAEVGNALLLSNFQMAARSIKMSCECVTEWVGAPQQTNARTRICF